MLADVCRAAQEGADCDQGSAGKRVRGSHSTIQRSELKFCSRRKQSPCSQCVIRVSDFVNALLSPGYLCATNQYQMFICTYPVRNVTENKGLSPVHCSDQPQPAMEIHEQEIVWMLRRARSTACGVASCMFPFAVVCPFWSGLVMSWKYPRLDGKHACKSAGSEFPLWRVWLI